MPERLPIFGIARHLLAGNFLIRQEPICPIPCALAHWVSASLLAQIITGNTKREIIR